MTTHKETKPTIIKIGTCPKCKKGEMIKGSIGYTCNYFKNINDKCTFNIYKEYFGKEITEDIALQLIETGKTEVFDDLTKKDGGIFSASLAYQDGFIKPQFKNKTLEYPCPVCGEKVEEFTSGYACLNYFEKDDNNNRTCPVFIPKIIAERNIEEQEAEMILKGEKTPFLDGFVNKKGNRFLSRLYFDKEKKTVTFDSVLCPCPKCGGDMYISKKAFNCSNYHNEDVKCDFSIWREISFRTITPEEAITLCKDKITPPLSGFRYKEEKLTRQLTINKDFKVVMI